MNIQKNFSVFVENLSELNNGNMVGEWVQFPCDLKNWEHLLVRLGNPEEIIITDIDNYTVLDELPIHEYSSYTELQELSEYLVYLENDEYKEALFAAVFSNIVSDFDEAKEAVTNESYMLIKDVSLAEYVEDMYVNSGAYDIPNELQSCIDWERVTDNFSSAGYTDTDYGVLIEQY